MVEIEELAFKLENIFNQVATDKGFDLYFRVKTPASFVDSIADEKKRKNIIPVYIDLPEGEYDAIPDTEIVSQTHRITFYFPIDLKIDIQRYLTFIPKHFIAKTLNIGRLSGSAICNISTPEFNGVDIMQFEKFKEFLGSVFNTKVSDSDYYAMYSLTLYTTSGDKLNEENGLYLGNNLDYAMSFVLDTTFYLCGYCAKYKGEFDSVNDLPSSLTLQEGDFACVKNSGVHRVYFDILEQELKWHLYLPNYVIEEDNFTWLDVSDTSSGSPISQQLMGEKKSNSVVNITNYARSIYVLFKNTTFWRKFVELYNLGELQNQDFIVYKDYGFANYTFNETNVDIEENIGRGEFLSYTFTFADKSSY